MQLYLLNQQYLDIAVAEAKASAHGWGWWRETAQPVDGTVLLLSRKKPSHLGLTHSVTKVLAVCAPGNIPTTLSSLQWNRIIGQRTYKVLLRRQTDDFEMTERELANMVWRQLEHPMVDLQTPKIIVDIIVTTKQAYIGTRVWTNVDEFQGRRAHLRPVLHPSSLHPALARALVNIGVSNSVHDAFCGTGGILIEAGLCGKRASGTDIDATMIAAARKNCAAFGVRPTLRVVDATMWVPRCGAVVADLPYGKNTTPVELRPLLTAFLRRASQSTRRAVIGLPVAIPVAAFDGWAVRAHLTHYVHKSMTKHFYVLERQ